MSLCLPTFLARLADPSIRTVLLCGCGGGFDFVHSLVLYPELKRLGKSVVIGSYSFGDPRRITGDARVVFNENDVIAKRVTASSIPAPHYGPEVHICSFLDATYPASRPHFVYAYYARAFSVPVLKRLYQQFIVEHSIDAIVLVDGGSDSLMVGDEEGLGDPIEDAVSVATVASLEGLKLKVLLSMGLGADRFNQVSDRASLRAIAELTAQGGFEGAFSLEPTNPGLLFYKACLEHIYQRQTFRSVLAGTIISAALGHYGSQDVPPLLQPRVQKGKFFLWPLMAMVWAFDVNKVAERSLIVDWLRDCQTVNECYHALNTGRQSLGHRIRAVENLPRHEEMRYTHFQSQPQEAKTEPEPPEPSIFAKLAAFFKNV
ncbi:MAG: DUF1152 domain-containing protein [Ardenticatenaceae bacterium]